MAAPPDGVPVSGRQNGPLDWESTALSHMWVRFTPTRATARPLDPAPFAAAATRPVSVRGRGHSTRLRQQGTSVPMAIGLPLHEPGEVATAESPEAQIARDPLHQEYMVVAAR